MFAKSVSKRHLPRDFGGHRIRHADKVRPNPVVGMATVVQRTGAGDQLSAGSGAGKPGRHGLVEGSRIVQKAAACGYAGQTMTMDQVDTRFQSWNRTFGRAQSGSLIPARIGLGAARPVVDAETVGALFAVI